MKLHLILAALLLAVVLPAQAQNPEVEYAKGVDAYEAGKMKISKPSISILFPLI